MDYIIPLEKYYDAICNLLQEVKFDRKKLLNIHIIFANISKDLYSVTKIKNWEQFEYGIESWDENNFFELVFTEVKNQKVLLVTDEGIKKKICFEFYIDSFFKFVEWYEEEFNVAFMQPSDYILILNNNNVIKALHHGGVILETQVSQIFD